MVVSDSCWSKNKSFVLFNIYNEGFPYWGTSLSVREESHLIASWRNIGRNTRNGMEHTPKHIERLK